MGNGEAEARRRNGAPKMTRSHEGRKHEASRGEEFMNQTNLAAGDRQIEFKEVIGYIKPIIC